MIRKITIALLAGALAFGVAGCSHDSGPQDPVSQQHAAISQKAAQIAQRSNGDWNKLSTADRSYYINTVGGGSETAARLSLQVMSGKGMPSSPGGPPANAAPPGAPGAPPAGMVVGKK